MVEVSKKLKFKTIQDNDSEGKSGSAGLKVSPLFPQGGHDQQQRCNRHQAAR
jgi:hypothetical protein